MKLYSLFITVFCIYVNISYSQEYHVFADVAGNIISEEDYKEQSKDKLLWRYNYQDSLIVNQIIDAPEWETRTSTYSLAKKYIENTTGLKYPDETIFLIDYFLHNDYCFTLENQKFWNDAEAGIFYDRFLPQVKTVERTYKNLKVILLLQQELSIPQNDKKREIFFKDIGNHFKNKFLKTPATCGHQILIKPNGEMLIHNGEHPIDWIAKKSKKKEWMTFFPSSDHSN